MESYIEEKKKLYTAIIEFLENSDENNDELYMQKFNIFENIIQGQQIEENKEEIKEFLQIFKSISANHHRTPNFIKKINNILKFYKAQIKQTLSNNEIFYIFQDNKILLLLLLENDIITISEQIYVEIMSKLESNGNRFCYFFYPEIENFIGKEKMEYIKKELLIKYPNAFENFDKKRKEGENDSHICSLIRNDSIVEFISYMNRNNYSISSQINPSIFETHSFLINNKNTTLIEYSAFFGAIQIFQYLLTNKAELTPSLWRYAIHSNNAELIHFLEINKVPPPIYIINCPKMYEHMHPNTKSNDLGNNYIHCLIESIKCHHNDIADYIENNFINEQNLQIKEKILSNYIKYHNYSYFQTDIICDYGFFYLCLYNYNILVNLLLEKKDKEIQSIII